MGDCANDGQSLYFYYKRLCVEVALDYSIFIITFLGLLFGSFANVLIYRIPLKQNIGKPARSFCPECKKTIPWYLNIPLFSWLLLRGKCLFCKKTIPVRYLLVELFCAIWFAVVFLRWGWSIATLDYLLFGYGLIVISFIDWKHFIIPNVFSYSGILLGLLFSLFAHRSSTESLLGFLIGGVGLFAISYLYLLIRKKEGMGMGDVKLLGWIGAVLGFKSLSFVLFFSSFLGITVAFSLFLFKRKKLNEYFAFGPYLAISAMVYLFFSESFSRLYLNFLQGLFL